jgi:hypothetical protein
MKTTIYRSEDRGQADHGWLKARHSFSFASWFKPDQMNFGLLRVLNDDIIAPGAGFPTHSHDNMEIVTIPLSGVLEHKDSMGNTAQVNTGEVQIMSAGTGVSHSEYNASKEEALKLFQIWIFPKKQNIEPRYGQMTIDTSLMNQWNNIVTPTGESGTLSLNQDAYISMLSIEEGKNMIYEKRSSSNGIYIMMISGRIDLENNELSKRDAIGIEDCESVSFTSLQQSRLLLIEVPMV